jgi:hypothetical protein
MNRSPFLGKKLCKIAVEVVTDGQFHKTFLGVIYATFGVLP